MALSLSLSVLPIDQVISTYSCGIGAHAFDCQCLSLSDVPVSDQFFGSGTAFAIFLSRSSKVASSSHGPKAGIDQLWEHSERTQLDRICALLFW
jgi:hypothetical protein